ncbi:MAG: helix-turn-helix domain-containing protein [Cyclobacteriaceae bacterium]
MEFSRELLFFFSALGAFNGLILGLYFIFFARPKHISSYFLGILLLTLSTRIGKSVFLYFNHNLDEIFLQIGISAVAFVGPSLYFYLRSITRPEIKGKSWIYHYVILLAGLVVVGVIYPWQTRPDVWHYIFNVIYLEWLLYLVVAGVLIKKSISALFRKDHRLASEEIWMLSIYVGNVLVWIAYNIVDYTSYIVGALSFSFILYLLVLFLFFTRKKDSHFLSRTTKYGDNKIKPEEAELIKSKLESLIQGEELYKDPNLKLPAVAKELNLLPHRLSQFVNDNLKKNFTLLINEYRVHEAKRLIESETHLKLESIGYTCGFNSKSTFYSAFKKQTGTTPAKYQEQVVGR